MNPILKKAGLFLILLMAYAPMFAQGPPPPPPVNTPLDGGIVTVLVAGLAFLGKKIWNANR